MAQYYSESYSDFREFSIRTIASGYDHHSFDTNPDTIGTETLPGLSGSYSYSQAAFFWDGTTNLENSGEVLALAGTGLAVNATGLPYAGTITGIANISSTYGAAYIANCSVSAAAFYNATRTTSTADDLAILRAFLSGSDRMILSTGADYVSGYAGNDKIYGGSGNDSLFGDTGMDTIYGGNANDKIYGGSGRDALYGGFGSDALTGGELRDVLDGGADSSRDLFIFADRSHSTVGDQRDVVQHFTRGTDDISVTLIDSNTRVANDQDFTFNGTTAKANAIWYSGTTGGIIVKGDVNGDKIADFEIKIEGISTITVGDFIL